MEGVIVDYFYFQFRFVRTREGFQGTMLDPRMGWLCKDVRDLLAHYVLPTTHVAKRHVFRWSHGPQVQFDVFRCIPDGQSRWKDFVTIATLRQRSVSVTLLGPRSGCREGQQFFVEFEGNPFALVIPRYTRGPKLHVRVGGLGAPSMKIVSLQHWRRVVDGLSPALPAFVRQKPFLKFCNRTLRVSSGFDSSWLFQIVQRGLNTIADLQVPLYRFS